VRRELRYFRLWLAVGWLIVMAVIGLSLVSKLPFPVSYNDKVGHFIAYAVLMGWFVQLFTNRWLLLVHALFLVGLGIGLEFAQEYYRRQFDYADMAANTLGVVFGLLLIFTPLRYSLQWFEGRVLRRNR